MLKRETINEVLLAALSSGADFAEIYVDNTFTNSISNYNGKIKNLNSGEDFGVGIRIFNGNKSIYTYANSSDRNILIKLASDASRALNGVRKIDIINLEYTPVKKNFEIKKQLYMIQKSEKIDLTKQAYEAAKSYSKKIETVNITYLDSTQNILIANSDGLLVEDKRVRTRTAISSIANVNGVLESGFEGPGASMGFEFYDSIDIKNYATEASRVALLMANAKPAPSGKMAAVIHNSFGGVIFHEACGHGLETTSVAKKTSVFTDKIGKQVASSIVTAIDDGTIANAWGSLNVDDEGMPTQKNVLIKDGILKSYLVDKLGARITGYNPTGSGRRASYRYAPTSRMNNTYIDNGESTFEEIIKATESGIFAKKIGGGSVDTTTGDFNFAASEAYLIENGEIKEPVRGATLVGNGPEILHNIDMVGNNLEHGQGMCGSISGSIPTNVGQPTIRVSAITVGGASNE